MRVERDQGEGEPVKIKPVGKRGRWQTVMESIPDDWVRVELCNKAGEVLWSLDEERPADEDEPVTARVAEADQLFQLVMRANDSAQSRAQEFAREQHQAMLAVVSVLTDRLVHLESNYSSVLQLAADTAQAAPQPEATSDTDRENAAMVNTVLKAGVDKAMQRMMEPNKNGAKKHG